MNPQLISIIIPTYKVEQYLSRCIDSVLSQKYQNWELILVDDGSPDSSGTICDEYANKDSRIRVIHQENAGASTARNTGINAAQGDCLCFIDADDYVSPDYLSSMCEEMENGVDLIFQGLIHLQGDKQTQLGFNGTKVYSLDASCNFFDEYNLFRFCGSYCKLFRREIIEKHHIRYSKRIICAEDYDFLLRYLVYSNKIKVLPCCNYFYISYPGSISTCIYSFDKEYSGLCQIANSMAEFAKKVSSPGLIKQQRYLVTYYTQRVMFSNYRNDYSHRERLANYNKIDTQYLDYFRKYHKPDTLFLTLVKYLYSYRCFSFLDLLMNKVARNA